jgi:hypothetical protein
VLVTLQDEEDFSLQIRLDTPLHECLICPIIAFPDSRLFIQEIEPHFPYIESEEEDTNDLPYSFAVEFGDNFPFWLKNEFCHSALEGHNV